MPNTKNGSATMELLKDLRQQFDQSLESASANLKDVRASLHTMEQMVDQLEESLKQN